MTPTQEALAVIVSYLPKRPAGVGRTRPGPRRRRRAHRGAPPEPSPGVSVWEPPRGHRGGRRSYRDGAMVFRPGVGWVAIAGPPSPLDQVAAEDAASEAYAAAAQAANVLEQYQNGAPQQWMRSQLIDALLMLEEARQIAIVGGADSLAYAIERLAQAVGRALKEIGTGLGDGFAGFWGEKPSDTLDRMSDELWWLFFGGAVVLLGGMFLAPRVLTAGGGAAGSVLTGQARVLRSGVGLVKPLAQILR